MISFCSSSREGKGSRSRELRSPLAFPYITQASATQATARRYLLAVSGVYSEALYRLDPLRRSLGACVVEHATYLMEYDRGTKAESDLNSVGKK